ncbi:MAG: M48 family metallopeptidase [Rhodospirillaceae bacterium]
MTPFALIFLAALLLTTGLRVWLARRHLAHVIAHRGAVPAPFAHDISLEAHQHAADYTAAKTRFAIANVLLEAALAVAFTFGGGLQLLYDAAAALVGPGIPRELAFIVFVMLTMTIIELPFSIYRTFVIEQRYGFNKMTPRLFVVDLVKNLVVGAVFGLPLAACILWLMERSGEQWWLYAWLVWVTFNVLLLAIYPLWIAPLFNKFSPLDDAELRERVQRLLERCGFKVKGLMVMDGSRRSSHGNAYFTGFGKSKRIVFFDTLLARLEPPEVEAVLAHELGHFRLKHVMKRMAWIFGASLAFMWLLDFLMHQAWFYEGLGVTTQSTAMALVLFFVIAPSFSFLAQPLLSAYSRRHEFEADRYATEHASARDLVTALVKLYKDNAATLTPDPLHSAFYDSHPPALQRIERLQQAAT